jgi:cell division protein ZapA
MQQPGAAGYEAAFEPEAVTVEIYDQTYTLRGTDPQHITTLAAHVDETMRAVAMHSSTVDSLRVAVLAALNLADELTRVQARCEALQQQVQQQQPPAVIRSRAGSLAGMLDAVLSDRKAS